MRASSLLLTIPLLGFSGLAEASSTGTAELMGVVDSVPPTVIFVVDLSSDMTSPCSATETTTCLEDTLEAIGMIVRHFNLAQYGVVGTGNLSSDEAYVEIAPVGSTYAEIASALTGVSAWTTTTRNLGETLEDLGESYLSQSTANDDEDDDGDGFTGDWGETPIAYSCSQTHFIVLAKDRPVEDDQVSAAYYSASNGTAGEIACDASGLTALDSQCYYDNVVAHMYNTDYGSSLTDTQRAVVHTIGLGVAAGSIADSLFSNASDNTNGDGAYTTADDQGEILAGITTIMSEIMAGVYSRSTPVITSDGAYMIYSFYELTGENPLAEGHVRAYAMDNDPTSSTYGEVLYEGPTEYGGAVWDGGDLLRSRPVTHAESNPEDRDGVGPRDIYTFEENAYLLASLGTEGSSYRRIGFDYEFVQAVGGSAATLSLYLDTAAGGTASCPVNDAYDLNEDCVVDGDDLQALVDFVRGLPTSEFKYIEMEHGWWKLGDSPYAVPAVVSARGNTFTTDTTYQAFLDGLVADGAPSIVLLPANDGMLHAFRLEDDASTTTEDEAGEELWAWIPGYLLMREKDVEWANSLIDLMWYGRTFLFDGSPVVEDVWIDEDGDGVKSPDGSEWHRVVVVSQGMGGPVTLALDITDPASPEYLWEQTNETDYTSMGYTVGRPVIFDVYDASNPLAPEDHWVAMWGGGRAVPYEGTSGTAYYETAEASLYMWNIADDFWGTESVGYSQDGDTVRFAEWPDSAAARGQLDTRGDADNDLEWGYVSSALAVVDVDGDGDGDVAYFPMTTAYRPTDEGGAGTRTAVDPGSSWMYKALINESNPDNLTWCEFYDPYGGTTGANGIGSRPEVYYSATTAWLADGALGVYWGTGTPFDRDSSALGYFFAMYDEDPTSCTSTAQPIPCNGEDGFYALNAGEGLTGDPLVYAGVVYFSTYQPDTADRCELGTGRIYGINFDDCSPALDPDGDGTSSASLTLDESEGQAGYPSAVTVTDQGTILFASSDGTDASVHAIRPSNDSFLGTSAIAWMEIY